MCDRAQARTGPLLINSLSMATEDHTAEEDAPIDDASLDSKESTDMILPPLPPTADEVRAAIVKDSAELTSLEHEVTKAENELTAALADQTQAINDMTRFLNASSAPSHP